MSNKEKSDKTKKKSSDERRKARRFNLELELHLVFDDLDELRQAYSKNVSEGGIFIATDQTLPIDSVLKLRISLVHKDITYIEASGKVAHLVEPGNDEEPGMGVEFTSMDDESKKFLKDYVELKSTGKSTKKKTASRKKTKKKAE